jgi:hypothetical protein
MMAQFLPPPVKPLVFLRRSVARSAVRLHGGCGGIKKKTTLVRAIYQPMICAHAFQLARFLNDILRLFFANIE